MELELAVSILNILNLKFYHVGISLIIYLAFAVIKVKYKVEFSFELKLFLLITLIGFTWLGVEQNTYNSIVSKYELVQPIGKLNIHLEKKSNKELVNAYIKTLTNSSK